MYESKGICWAHHVKTFLRLMRTAKAQISLRIRTVWLGPLPYANTTEFMNWEQRPVRFFAHAQDVLNLRLLRMLECTFSLHAAHIKFNASLDNNKLNFLTSC